MGILNVPAVLTSAERVNSLCPNIAIFPDSLAPKCQDLMLLTMLTCS